MPRAVNRSRKRLDRQWVVRERDVGGKAGIDAGIVAQPEPIRFAVEEICAVRILRRRWPRPVFARPAALGLVTREGHEVGVVPRDICVVAPAHDAAVAVRAAPVALRMVARRTLERLLIGRKHGAVGLRRRAALPDEIGVPPARIVVWPRLLQPRHDRAPAGVLDLVCIHRLSDDDAPGGHTARCADVDAGHHHLRRGIERRVAVRHCVYEIGGVERGVAVVGRHLVAEVGAERKDVSLVEERGGEIAHEKSVGMPVALRVRSRNGMVAGIFPVDVESVQPRRFHHGKNGVDQLLAARGGRGGAGDGPPRHAVDGYRPFALRERGADHALRVVLVA